MVRVELGSLVRGKREPYGQKPRDSRVSLNVNLRHKTVDTTLTRGAGFVCLLRERPVEGTKGTHSRNTSRRGAGVSAVNRSCPQPDLPVHEGDRPDAGVSPVAPVTRDPCGAVGMMGVAPPPPWL